MQNKEEKDKNELQNHNTEKFNNSEIKDEIYAFGVILLWSYESL